MFLFPYFISTEWSDGQIPKLPQTPVCRAFPFEERSVSMSEACRRQAFLWHIWALIYSVLSGLDFHSYRTPAMMCLPSQISLFHQESSVRRTEVCVRLHSAVIMTVPSPVYDKEQLLFGNRFFVIGVCLKQNTNRGNRGVCGSQFDLLKTFQELYAYPVITSLASQALNP